MAEQTSKNISEIFKRAAKNHSLSQSQQQTQATDILEDEIKMSINLPYVEGNFKYLDIVKYYTLSRVKSLLKDQFIN